MKCSIIVLLCGLPGSGKTYLINYIYQLEKKCRFDAENNEIVSNIFAKINLHCISYDELITSHKQKEMICTPGAWKECRKNILCAAESFIQFISGISYPCIPLSKIEELYLKKLIQSNKMKKNCNQVFLIEDNFYYQSMRYEWYQIAQKLGIAFCQIYLDCPCDISVSRNKNRARSIPNDVILSMAEKIEVPDPNKNNWEKHTMIVDAINKLDENYINRILDFIDNTLKKPVVPVIDKKFVEENSRRICSTNAIHQIDILLRKLAGEKIKQKIILQKDNKDIKAFSKEINEARQEVLTKLKCGKLVLENDILIAIEEGRQDDIATYLHETIKLMLDSLIKEKS